MQTASSAVSARNSRAPRPSPPRFSKPPLAVVCAPRRPRHPRHPHRPTLTPPDTRLSTTISTPPPLSLPTATPRVYRPSDHVNRPDDGSPTEPVRPKRRAHPTSPALQHLPPLERVANLASLRIFPDVFTVASSYVNAGQLAPNLQLYEILITACAVAPSNSLQVLAFQLLAEMKERRILPSVAIYHSLLRLLAKSPDYIARSEVLAEMSSRWITLNDQDWAWVVQGFIKDVQFEIALEMIAEREASGMRIDKAVYKDLIGTLTAVGEVEEALRWLKLVEGEMGALSWSGLMNEDERARMWYELLAAAAKELNGPVTNYVWFHCLAPLAPIFSVPEGLRILVLNCAARAGDSALAAAALAQGDAAAAHHYAACLEAQARAADWPALFKTLKTMRAAGVSASVQPCVPLLATSKDAVDAAAAVLPEDAEGDLAAVELLMAAYMRLHEIDAAFEVYTRLPLLTAAGPTTQTFNILLAGCAELRQKELAAYTASEMRELRVRPDGKSYEALIRVCAQDGGVEGLFEGLLWLEEMKVAGYVVGERTWMALVRACVKGEDWERAGMLLAEMKEAGVDVAWVQKQVERARKGKTWDI